IKVISEKLFQNSAYNKNDIDILITGNYNLSIQKNYAILLGLNPNILFTENITSFAHIYSCDQIIALNTLEKNKQVEKGSKCLLLGTGDVYWGAIITEKV